MLFAGTSRWHRAVLGMGAAEVEMSSAWGDSLQFYHCSSAQPDIPKASQLCFLSSWGCFGIGPSPYVSPLPFPPSLLTPRLQEMLL